MSTATAVSLSEYLNTSYRPDCDYLDGELLKTRQTYVSTAAGIRESRDGLLSTENPDIQVNPSELEQPQP